jgi:hypothetical protein
MNEAIDQINAEIERLQGQISTLEKARDLLAGLANPLSVKAVKRDDLKQSTSIPKTKGSIAEATRWAVSQMSGQFLTGDITKLVKQQGYTESNVCVAVCWHVSRMCELGFLKIISKRRGHGGNTWIKTAELDAKTTPTLTEKPL